MLQPLWGVVVQPSWPAAGIAWWLIMACTGFCYAGPPSSDLTENVSVYSRWETFTTRDGLPGNDIRAIRVVRDQVWIGTDGGMARLDAKGWKAWTVHDGLPVSMVTAIDVDPVTDEVWLGTWGGGLVRFSAGRMDVFNQLNSGLAGNLVLAVLIDGDRVWVASNGGISSYRRRDAAWNLYDPRRADASPSAITTFVLNGGSVHAAAWHGGVRRYDPGRNEWLPLVRSAGDRSLSRPGFPKAIDTTLAIVRGGGHLWWATQDTLSRRNASGEWSTRKLDGWGGGDRFVHCLAAANDGRVALGARVGLAELVDWTGGAWLHYRRRPGGPNAPTTVVLRQAGRTLGARALPSTIPDNEVQCIAFGTNDIWVGTANGLTRGSRRARWDTLPPTAKDDAPQVIAGPTSSAASSPSLPRKAAEWAQVSSVAIGIFGPRTKTIALPGRYTARPRHSGRCDLLAVQLATGGANKRGGYRGRIPYDLALRPLGYANYGWGLPEDDLPGLGNREGVVGIVGLLEPDDWLTDVVALRTKVPVVNVGSGGFSDEPTSENPWVFRCMGDRPQRHRRLLDWLFDHQGFRRPAVLHNGSPEARRHLAWWKDHATRRGLPLVAAVTYDPGTDDLDAILRSLDRSTPDVLLASCDASVAAAVVRRMRSMEMNQLFVGGKAIVTDAFIEQVGPDAGAVAAVYSSRPPRAGKIVQTFAREYAERSAIRDIPQPPPPGAYRTMYAVDHLLAAIEQAGPDRASLRNALERMSRSVNGERHYEQLHDNGQTLIAWLESGRWLSRPLNGARSRILKQDASED